MPTDSQTQGVCLRISNKRQRTCLLLTSTLTGTAAENAEAVVEGVENTIRAVSTIARDGMRGTDKEVIRLMMGN